jgi:hypothetical protein
MKRQCNDQDFETVSAIINNAAQAYKGVIPPDRRKDPYMSKQELGHEMNEGVQF